MGGGSSRVVFILWNVENLEKMKLTINLETSILSVTSLTDWPAPLRLSVVHCVGVSPSLLHPASLCHSSSEEAANWAICFIFSYSCVCVAASRTPRLPRLQFYPRSPSPSYPGPPLEKRSACWKASSKRTSAPSAPWLTADDDLIFVCCVFCKMSKNKNKKRKTL